MAISKKTIFDYCKDKATIKEIIGGDYSESYYKEFPKVVIAEHLIEYAIKVKDKDLYNSARSFYENEKSKSEKRSEEMKKQGFIID